MSDDVMVNQAPAPDLEAIAEDRRRDDAPRRAPLPTQEELDAIAEERRREEEARRAPLPTQEDLDAIAEERRREQIERTAPGTLAIQERIAAWHRLNEARQAAEAAASAAVRPNTAIEAADDVESEPDNG